MNMYAKFGQILPFVLKILSGKNSNINQESQLHFKCAKNDNNPNLDLVNTNVCIYIPDKKETHTVAFSNFLGNNKTFSYFIYTDL